MKKFFYILPLVALLAFAACSDDKENDNSKDKGNIKAISYDHYAFLLNEGSWGENNASLTLIDLDNKAANDHFFEKVNNRKLGDVAQDMIIYGSKLYISVFGSNTIEVVDPATGKSLKQINMESRQPRYLAAYDGKVYATCYTPRSVVRIDTASFSIEATCTLSGLNPEGITATKGKLYVANSYESLSDNSINYDNTVSVVDVETFSEVSKVTVGTNPNFVAVVPNLPNYVAVGYYGDYGSNPSGIAVINVDNTSSVTKFDGIPMTGLTASDVSVYTCGSEVVSFSPYTTKSVYYKVDLSTMVANQILTAAASAVMSPYGISINPLNGDILAADALDYQSSGYLYIYNSAGEIRGHVDAGRNPRVVCVVK